LQAQRNGGLLNELIADKDRFGFVSSPLTRARQTMEILRAGMGLSADGYCTDERLREIAFGEWAGLTWPEIMERDPDLCERRTADRWNVAAPGGQCYREMYRSVGEWLAGVTSDTVVVAHYGTARLIRGHILKLPPEEILSLEAPQDKVLMIDGETLNWL